MGANGFSRNLRSHRLLAARREAFWRRRFAFTPAPPGEAPPLLLSVVTFNSERWVRPFAESLARQRYPLNRIRLVVVDHESGDGTVAAWQDVERQLGGRLRAFERRRQPNRGFGAGHNLAIRDSQEPFLLVSNVDLEFEPDTIPRLVETAWNDEPDVASWEARQKPFEHPHYYDPVTLETEYSAHACVLFRAAAFRAAGGYDERFFIYGEDADLSFRLRRQGDRLRYVPAAVVWHWWHDPAAPVKLHQYCGSHVANALNRLRYGSWRDISAIPRLGLRLRRDLAHAQDGRRFFRQSLRRFLRLAPLFLFCRGPTRIPIPFHNNVYALPREGAFLPARRPRDGDAPPPRVRAILRPASGRGRWLDDCLATLVHQTHPRLEVIVVAPDGSWVAQRLKAWEPVFDAAGVSLRTLVAGGDAAEIGLSSTSSSEYWAVLDDATLLFADHFEFLVAEAQAHPEVSSVGASYWSQPADEAGLPLGMPRTPPAAQPPFDPRRWAGLTPFPCQAFLFRATGGRPSGDLGRMSVRPEAANDWIRMADPGDILWLPRTTSIVRVNAKGLDPTRA